MPTSCLAAARRHGWPWVARPCGTGRGDNLASNRLTSGNPSAASGRCGACPPRPAKTGPRRTPHPVRPGTVGGHGDRRRYLERSSSVPFGGDHRLTPTITPRCHDRDHSPALAPAVPRRHQRGRSAGQNVEVVRDFARRLLRPVPWMVSPAASRTKQQRAGKTVNNVDQFAASVAERDVVLCSCNPRHRSTLRLRH